MTRLAAAVVFAAVVAALAAPAFALAPGNHAIELRHSGLERRYVIHVPPALRERPAVVLNLHGGGGNALAHQQYVRMDLVADREGFLVVYPDGTGPIRGRLLTWNAGTCCGVAQADDVGFVRAVLDDLAGRIAYDASRVYATGLSNGAMMSYRLAAELSDRIAAIAPVAGSMVLLRFSAQRPVPVMHIHSVDDPRAPSTTAGSDRRFR